MSADFLFSAGLAVFFGFCLSDLEGSENGIAGKMFFAFPLAIWSGFSSLLFLVQVLSGTPIATILRSSATFVALVGLPLIFIVIGFWLVFVVAGMAIGYRRLRVSEVECESEILAHAPFE